MSDLRTYVVAVEGFDFRHTYARATTRSRANAIVASSFEDAGWGSFGDGLRSIVSTRLCPEADDWPLIYPRRGPEGLVAHPRALAYREDAQSRRAAVDP